MYKHTSKNIIVEVLLSIMWSVVDRIDPFRIELSARLLVAESDKCYMKEKIIQLNKKIRRLKEKYEYPSSMVYHPEKPRSGNR